VGHNSTTAGAPRRYSHSAFFVLRTPLLPVDELVQWGQGLAAVGPRTPGTDSHDLKTAWESDVRILRARLREMVARPEIRQALYIASPSLLEGIEQWRRDPDSKKGLQAERALARYVARMCVRCTPFGVFSGCSVGRVTDETEATNLALASRDKYRTSSRLDFDYLFALSASFRNDAQMVSELRYWPNTSLRRIGNAWHYIESRQAGSQRTHHLVKLEDDPYLSGALHAAAGGVLLPELAVSMLAAPTDEQPSLEEVQEYLLELVSSEVLVSSLVPLVTGEPALDDMILQLEALTSGQGAAASLRRVREDMRTLDARGLGSEPAEYQRIADQLKDLPAKADASRLYQVDMFKAVVDARLSPSVIDELATSVDVLCRLGRADEPEELKTFIETFSERYDRAVVPLLEALDEETGVGFGRAGAGEASPLIRGLRIGLIPASAGRPEAQTLMLRNLLQRPRATGGELAIDPADLPPIQQPMDLLPRAFCLAATLVAPSPAAVDAGDFAVYLRGTFGPSGARLLGRFCHGDAELERHVRRHLEHEEAQDAGAVYAEVVYAPEGRVGNVLCRPVLRGYEIPYLGRSGAPSEKQIPVSDLMVGVDVDRIFLYSRRLQKEIVPRLSNAHGFANPKLANVYRFLCYLQNQRARIPGFSWGTLLNSLEYLPRIRVGRVVLALARWRLSKDDIDALTKSKRHNAFAAAQRLRERMGWPRWILFEENDNALPVDLDNAISVDAFVHVLGRVASATVTEMYPSPDEQCVSGPEGRFCHELNIPFVLSGKIDADAQRFRSQRIARAAQHIDVGPLVRSFSPVTEWLYVKAYAAGGIQDEIITTAIPAILAQVATNDTAARWFFVRYADPRDHLRVRFNGEAGRIRKDLLPIVSDVFGSLLASGRVWKIEFGTYNREIERYGGVDATAVAEDVFHADSEAVAAIIRVGQEDQLVDQRWRIALWGIDRLFDDLGLDLEMRRTQVARWRDGLDGQFQIHRATKHALGDRFRAERRRVEAMFWRTGEGSAELEQVWDALRQRSVRNVTAVTRLKALADSGSLRVPLLELLGIYVHMHVNRLMRFAGAMHEPALYEFLYRLYDGRIASQRGVKNIEAKGGETPAIS
jgi:thiopeptide-type bacteriocin biosynthesis protein